MHCGESSDCWMKEGRASDYGAKHHREQALAKARNEGLEASAVVSERMQRQLDRLLDEAEAAVTAQEWERVAGAARAALAIDDANADALTFLKMAAANGVESPADPSSATTTGIPASEDSATPAPAAKVAGPPPANPETFVGGRYRVLRFLGEGGKKRVFLAHDVTLDRDVAFALIKTEGLDLVGRERIVREAQAMGRLGSDPHIVSIFDIGEEQGAPYVVTELMDGGDVEGLLEKAQGPLPTERTLQIAKDVTRGLIFAHARQVIHRDLKPGNVWLTADGTAKIGDFGLAVSLDRSRLTQHGFMVGTVSYMPPEQALGGEPTPQSDLYSLGAMLYELVTGRPPFAGDDPTAVISQHINTPPVAPSWQSEHCPPELEDLTLKLLAKVPQDRPASAQDVLDVLERVDVSAPSRRHSGADANPLDRLARGVFVGRARELERLRSSFDEAFAGRGNVVMLVGEPGIGKTRAAQEIETYARTRGAYAFWGRTHESGGAPAFWPWIQVGNAWGGAVDLVGTGGQALRTDTSLAPGTSELVRLFPALRTLPGFVEPLAAEDPESAQFRLFDAYATFMRNQSAGRPWLVILDDLHWADKPTLLLLQHVARELANMRALVIGTYRDTELLRTHPLSEALAALNRESGFLRLPLKGLSHDEVGTYLTQRAGAAPARELVSRIYEETEGNPFFLSEVVNLMAEEGTLGKASVSGVALPEGVREALGRRLDRLSGEANELLQVCAIVGREFAYDTLTLLVERGPDDLLRLVEEALAARVLEETETAGRYRFTHALMQETLLAELSTTRRVRLHGQVGEALERRYGANAGAQAARLALHFGESATLTPDHARKAAHYARLAGEQAEAQSGWDDAARHYAACLALVQAADDRLGEDEAALLEALGRCELNAQRFRPAWRSLLNAIDLYRGRGDWAAGARSTLLAVQVPAPSGRILGLLDTALSTPGQRDARLEASLLAERVSNAAASSQQRTADAERARELAGAAGYQDVLGQLTMAAALRVLNSGKPAEAERLYREAGEQFQAAGMPLRSLEPAHQSAVCILYLGRLDEACDRLRQLLETARRLRHRYEEQNALSTLGAIAVLRCDLAQATALLDEMPPGTFTIEVMRTTLALASGDLRGLESNLPDPAQAGGVPFFGALVHGTRARAFFLARQDDRARAEVEALATIVDAAPEAVWWAGFVDDALAALAGEAFVRRVYEAGENRGSLRSTPGGSFDRSRGSLALRLGLIDDAGRHFLTGLEWCERERCPVEAGRCLQGLAEVAERRGEHALAREYLDRAADLFSEHGAKLYLEQALAKKEILKA
ncbi:MAG TPA: protein kinase [Solirubrobacteraceae bacterium]|nr:protein kinase [Solirubrobacteraceae bacterium]